MRDQAESRLAAVNIMGPNRPAASSGSSYPEHLATREVHNTVSANTESARLVLLVVRCRVANEGPPKNAPVIEENRPSVVESNWISRDRAGTRPS